MRRKTKYPGVTRVGPRSFEIRTRIRDPRSGKRRGVRRTVHCTTLNEAAVALLDMRKEMQKGLAQPQLPRRGVRLTLGDYAKSWLERKIAT